MTRRRPVRNPDLLHVFATVGAHKALKEDSSTPPPSPAEALDELQNNLRLDPRTYVLTDVIRAAMKPASKELTPHDHDVVRRTVKTAMSGGYSQVYGWSGLGFKEHWADSIALGIVTNREGVVDTDWVHQVRLAVYLELGLETVDLASPVRTSDLTGSKT